MAGKIAAITAEAIVGDAMDEEHREYYALATRRGATTVKRRVVEVAGKQASKIATKVAANLEFRLGRRTRLSRTFRRVARRNVKMIKRQQRWRRRDALLKERAKEVEAFREIELKKWQMAVDFDKGKKYWYHLETGEQRQDDPAIEAEKERVRDAKRRRAMEVLRLTGRKKSSGGGGTGGLRCTGRAATATWRWLVGWWITGLGMMRRMMGRRRFTGQRGRGTGVCASGWWTGTLSARAGKTEETREGKEGGDKRDKRERCERRT